MTLAAMAADVIVIRHPASGAHTSWPVMSPAR
jgi:aspartate carbamoyltransferase catalytic subunit